MNKSIVLIITILCFRFVWSSKILGVFPLEWESHYILGLKLMKGLAEAGHDVTFISPRRNEYVPKNGSWTEIVLNEFTDEFQAILKKQFFYEERRKNVLEKIKGFETVAVYISNLTLRNPDVQKLLRSNNTFDAVIIEQLMNDCHHVFAYHFKSPLIILCSVGPNQFINSKTGNSAPIATVPHIFNSVEDPYGEMNFPERLKNMFIYIVIQFYYYYKILPQHDLILRETIPGAPHIYDLYYNTSFVLLNSHTGFEEAVPLVPNMAEIGGYHIDPPQQSPKDLKRFLDNAKDGAIYFSMGSSLNSKDMNEIKKKMFLGVFERLRQRILWKYEEDLANVSNNVLIKSWMPQQDILAHPKILLFITHGGLLSITETIHHGVPILSIPVFSDQESNSRKAVQRGFGLKLSYTDENFSEDTLYNLIQELLNNPMYRKNAQAQSRIYHDRPIPPMKNAIYWVEYVIRHNGAPHLRVAGVEISWYKYCLLDILASLLGILVFCIYVVAFIFRKILRLSKKDSKEKSH